MIDGLEINIPMFLPHQKPMLMVDSLVDISDKKVHTTFEILPDNIFAENGVFNEAGLIENAAQTCSCIGAFAYYKAENKAIPLIGFISSIKKLDFFNLPEVGSSIHTEAELLHFFYSGSHSLIQIACTSFQEKKLLLQANMTLFLEKVMP